MLLRFVAFYAQSPPPKNPFVLNGSHNYGALSGLYHLTGGREKLLCSKYPQRTCSHPDRLLSHFLVMLSVEFKKLLGKRKAKLEEAEAVESRISLTNNYFKI